ncbi:SurA N-terminal domain-containing protein [Streptomyces litchfieldiae]|uniref:SurA N-terminal domain-containing protein n=1 Tax=Streptomyces litchfieldiae TaxID=3075543 RepID=A0ABU2N2K2_9ACTN|nr:SurA N-terminal domain-containing protein [Streptomyces sp. DSM 44938]MDT0346959.1 SurA N-terminal domain-containing protein [Streptomyces sp. DSM 44938]
MKRRRTSALSVSAAALLATAAPLLTGCSTDAHPGAAAVVGGERITVASVQAQVETVRDAQRARPEGDQLISASSGLTRDTVEFLVYAEVLERAAQDAGVELTRRDVQEYRAQTEASVGGAEALAEAVLMPQNGTPLAGEEQIDRMLRTQLLFQSLAQELGVAPDANGLTQMAAVLAETAEEIGVEVNPRYGEWDAEQVLLADAPTPWLRSADEDEATQAATLDG